MDKLPKDVLVALVLDMDIEYVIRLCQSSSIFNNKICKNNYFWLNRVQKDYGLTTALENAKKEYLTVQHLLKTDPGSMLDSAIYTKNFKLVKQAVEAGADINKRIKEYYPITLSVIFESDDILKFLLNKIDNEKNSALVVSDITRHNNDLLLNKQDRCKSIIRLYSVILPHVSKFLLKPKWAMFWDRVVIKLEDLYREDKWCISDEFYNKWRDFYRKQAE